MKQAHQSGYDTDRHPARSQGPSRTSSTQRAGCTPPIHQRGERDCTAALIRDDGTWRIFNPEDRPYTTHPSTRRTGSYSRPHRGRWSLTHLQPRGQAVHHPSINEENGIVQPPSSGTMEPDASSTQRAGRTPPIHQRGERDRTAAFIREVHILSLGDRTTHPSIRENGVVQSPLLKR
jgi:hypothetical protein